MGHTGSAPDPFHLRFTATWIRFVANAAVNFGFRTQWLHPCSLGNFLQMTWHFFENHMGLLEHVKSSILQASRTLLPWKKQQPQHQTWLLPTANFTPFQPASSALRVWRGHTSHYHRGCNRSQRRPVSKTYFFWNVTSAVVIQDYKNTRQCKIVVGSLLSNPGTKIKLALSIRYTGCFFTLTKLFLLPCIRPARARHAWNEKTTWHPEWVWISVQSNSV